VDDGGFQKVSDSLNRGILIFYDGGDDGNLYEGGERRGVVRKGKLNMFVVDFISSSN